VRNYDVTWTVGLVSTVHKTYARATYFLEDLLDIDDLSIAKLFLEERLDWYRYKKLLRSVENALNARIVVSPEKVYKQFELCQKDLDTRKIDVTLVEPEKMG